MWSLWSFLYIVSRHLRTTVSDLPFQFRCPVLSCLIAVARISNTMLNKSGKNGLPCLVPDIRGKAFIFSPLTMMLTVDLLYMDFIMLRYVPSILTLLRVFFFCKDVKFCKMLFPHLLKWSYDFCLSICWCITLIDSCMLSHFYILGMNPTWSWCVILLMHYWIMCGDTLLRIFASMFSRDICLQFSFLVLYFTRFGIRVRLA